MSAHTTGPWVMNYAGSGRSGAFSYDEIYVFAPNCGVDDVAIAAEIADPLTGKPSEANARLIAAAPELLDALQMAEGWMKTVIEDTEWVDEADEQHAQAKEELAQVRAAIAKASAV